MIDTIALALGHGLLAIAMMRLVMREALDVDPLLGDIKSETEGNRKAASVSGRNEARRARRAASEAGEDGA
ncbi:hypothetical protein [Porphyrobacter sp. AAP82]|uniref:hypothetical protein n=1 Tax=Porphyrobacter sp. AAP82 TaxID=1248917 RepID=UPI00030C6D43|nr:hypothetical protein [Porphyrobacter sp. AAP82]